MPTRIMKLMRIFGGLGVLLLVLILGYLVVRPWHLVWGTTSAERSQAMPGDLYGRRWTRAITINTTPEQIWPWLVQWGQGRGGWYSYDWLENLFGFDIHTADSILPQYQDLAIGDTICLAPDACFSQVTVLEPNRWLAWQAKEEDGTPVWTFAFGLYPLDATHTRLVIRESFSKADAMPFVASLLEGPDAVMELKSLHTVKDRAEGVRESILLTPYEILVWLVALVIGVIAGVRFITSQRWLQPLAVGLASVVILLLLTFLYPPLWLRLVLDLGLLLGLLWSPRNQSAREFSPVTP